MCCLVGCKINNLTHVGRSVGLMIVLHKQPHKSLVCSIRCSVYDYMFIDILLPAYPQDKDPFKTEK